MRICIVGGIYDKDPAYRERVTVTPETVLSAGLRARGHHVEERGLWTAGDLSSFEIVHVHHLAPGTIVCSIDPGPARLVFTNHAGSHPSRLHAMAFRFVARRADAVVALSAAEARWQRRQTRLTRRHVVIGNGIDAQRFRFVAPTRASDAPWRLLYVGQLVPLKGLSDLLEALTLVRPRREVVLELVYHVESQLAELQDQVAELGLTGVRFLGARTPDELAALYAECHMLVLPSLSEALPSVITEAMLVGRPVVATDVGGVRDQVGDFGAVVRPGSASLLAEAIEAVIGRYGELAAMAPEARERTAARFSVDAMVEAHEDLYRGLLTRAPRRHAPRWRPGAWVARGALQTRRVQRLASAV